MVKKKSKQQRASTLTFFSFVPTFTWLTSRLLVCGNKWGRTKSAAHNIFIDLVEV